MVDSRSRARSRRRLHGRSERRCIVIPVTIPRRSRVRPSQRLRRHGEVRLYTDRPATPEEKLARARDAVCLVNTRGTIKWPREALLALPRLRWPPSRDRHRLFVSSRRGKGHRHLQASREDRADRRRGRRRPHAGRGRARALPHGRQGRPVGRRGRRLFPGQALGMVGTGDQRVMTRLGRALGIDVVAWTFHPEPRARGARRPLRPAREPSERRTWCRSTSG